MKINAIPDENNAEKDLANNPLSLCRDSLPTLEASKFSECKVCILTYSK